MEINGEQVLPASRQRVWEALNDPAVLQACILGCEELEKITDVEMKSVVLAKFGPIKARFKSDITMENVEPASSCTLVGNGQGGVAGFAKGNADIRLIDDDEGTLLQYDVSFSVGGKIAQIGSRLLKGTTVKIVNHFFEELQNQLSAPQSE